MQVQIKAWGNSQGIRLSKDILEEADIDNVRRFSKLGRIPISDVINISDAIQGIFDYM